MHVQETKPHDPFIDLMPEACGATGIKPTPKHQVYLKIMLPSWRHHERSPYAARFFLDRIGIQPVSYAQPRLTKPILGAGVAAAASWPVEVDALIPRF